MLRDVGAVHERLLPGRVTDTRIEGDQRFLTFPDGHVIREWIVAIDDDARRLAYSVEGARPPAEHHHASFEVRPEGDRAGRLIWITDASSAWHGTGPVGCRSSQVRTVHHCVGQARPAIRRSDRS